jgi:hypothetical protein
VAGSQAKLTVTQLDSSKFWNICVNVNLHYDCENLI